MKRDGAVGGADQDAVGNEGMEVDIEVEMAAEALDPGHRAGETFQQAKAPRPSPLPGEHGPEEDAEHLVKDAGPTAQRNRRATAQLGAGGRQAGHHGCRQLSQNRVTRCRASRA